MSDTSDRIADIVRAQDLTAPQLLSELEHGGLVSDVIVIVKYVDSDGRGRSHHGSGHRARTGSPDAA